MVEPIVPSDSLQYLQVTTYQPITSLHDHLHKVINTLLFVETAISFNDQLKSLSLIYV